jgi:signal recognition particle subunit SRP54
MLPGVPKELRNAEIDDAQFHRIEAIIRSMTLEERARPELIDGSRRRRIANGSGTQPSEVNALVDQFRQMRTMMRQLGPMTGLVRRGGKKNKKKGGRVTPKKGVAVAPGASPFAGLPGGLPGGRPSGPFGN